MPRPAAIICGPMATDAGKPARRESMRTAAERAVPDDVRVQLGLLDENRFRNGVVHLHYGVRSVAAN